jgi:hypothetical protein
MLYKEENAKASRRQIEGSADQTTAREAVPARAVKRLATALLVLLVSGGLMNCGPDNSDLSTVEVKNENAFVRVKDGSHNLTFLLPAGWSMVEKLEKPEDGGPGWRFVLRSESGEMAMRFGVTPAEEAPLAYHLANYVRQRVGASSKEQIQGLMKNIKSITAEETLRYNVESGYVVHILSGEGARNNTDGWGREHVIALKRNDSFYFVSMIAKNNFFAGNNSGDKDEMLKAFADKDNPIFTVSTSLRFENE